MTILSFLILLAGTIGWFLLPLIPAIRELVAPVDVAPLEVVGRDAGDVAFFARGFRRYMTGQLDGLQPGLPPEYLGRLPDGTLFARVTSMVDTLARGAEENGAHDRLMLLEKATVLEGGEMFLREVYGRSDILGGPDAAYRALLGDGSISLGERSRVLRWVHAVGPLIVGAGSSLLGRVSSDTSVLLGRGTLVERVGAPVIRTAERTEPRLALERERADGESRMFELPVGSRQIGNHLRIEGDLELPWHTVMETNLVVAGTLQVGPRARIQGNVKAHGDVVTERGSRITGSLVGRAAVTLGEDASVGGPIIAEGPLEIRSGVTIGAPDALTTISAPSLKLGLGVTIHGQIVARDGVRVV
ncbi:MAG: polymer-forming cytoskeletal protein [Gemmatimonadota bacterium]